MCINCKHNSVNCPYFGIYGLYYMGHQVGCPYYEASAEKITAKSTCLCAICGKINTNEHNGKLYCKECEKKWM